MTRASSDAARYVVILAATIVAVTVAYVSGLWALDLRQLKPPPAFTNSLCADVKLEFLRENPPGHPTHLIVGSSVSWRNIAGEVIVARYPQARPLNAGFCGLRINQTAFVTRFLLERFRTVTDVLLVLDPTDMSDCNTTKAAVFDAADVAAYLSGADDLEFYFKYFDLPALLRNAIGLRARRVNAAKLDPLVFTRYGDGPLDTNESRGVFYGPARDFDPVCQRALAKLANDVGKRGIRLLVATMPLLSEWSSAFDDDSKVKARLADQIRDALRGTSATFWDGWAEVQLPAAGYTDAYHLRWSAALDFTRDLVAATRFGSVGN